MQLPNGAILQLQPGTFTISDTGLISTTPSIASSVLSAPAAGVAAGGGLGLGTILAGAGGLALLSAGLSGDDEEAPKDTSSPLIATAPAVTVNENSAIGIDVDAIDANASGGDNSANITYSLVGGTDQSLFTIDGRTGEVFFINNPDYENAADLADGDGLGGADNDYEIVVRVTDNSGNFVEQAITITVVDADDAPDLGDDPDEITLDENAVHSDFYQAQATDQDAGDTATYSLDAASIAAGFTIDADSGQISLTNEQDFEGAVNTFSLIVTATDTVDSTLTDTQTVKVKIGDVNEAPVFASATASANLAENSAKTTFYTAAASDPDVDDQAGVRYSLDTTSLTNGFVIDEETGAVSHSTGLNYEDGTHEFTVTISATDGEDSSLIATQTLTVNLTDVDEIGPTVTSISFDDSTAIKAGETKGLTLVFSEAVTDFDADDLTVLGGEISNLTSSDKITWTATFTPDANTAGTASVTVGSDYTDEVGNGGTASSAATVAYDTIAPTVTITADQAALTGTDKTVTLTFTFSETPGSSFTKDDITITSGLGTLGTLSGSGTVYTIVFTADDDIQDSLAVSVAASAYSDAAGNAGQAGALATDITIDTLPPEFTSDAALAISENIEFSHTVVATDASNSLSYSLVSGDDAGLFSLTSAGVLTLNSAAYGSSYFDHEDDQSTNATAANVYQLTVEASDGNGNTQTQQITVTVSDLTTAPEISEDASINFDENSTATVYTITPLGNDATVTYSLQDDGSGGVDWFQLDTDTGAIIFYDTAGSQAFSPNFEEADEKTFTFQIKATNAENISSLQTVTVNVQDVNDAPTVDTTAVNSKTVVEGGTYSSFQADFQAAYQDQDATDTQVASVKITSLPAAGAGTLRLSGTALDLGSEGFVVLSYADLANLTFTANDVLSADADASFSFTFLDDEGAESTSASFDLTVSEQNDSPTIDTELANISVDEDVSHTFAATDFGFEDEEDANLTSITITAFTGDGTLSYNGSDYTSATFPASLTIAFANIGDLSFISASEGSGDAYASLSYTAADSDGASTSATTLTIDVTEVADDPVSEAVEIAIDEDASFNFGSTSFLYEDADTPGADTATHLVIKALPDAAIGTLTLSDVAVTVDQEIALTDLANLVFTPAENVNGNDLTAFTYQVKGDQGTTQTYSLTVDIAALDDAVSYGSTLSVSRSAGAYTAGNEIIDVNDFLVADTGDAAHAVYTYSLDSTSELAGFQIDSAGIISRSSDLTFTSGDVYSFTVEVSEASTATVVSENMTVTIA